jgi:hypothetical protein
MGSRLKIENQNAYTKQNPRTTFRSLKNGQFLQRGNTAIPFFAPHVRAQKMAHETGPSQNKSAARSPQLALAEQNYPPVSIRLPTHTRMNAQIQSCRYNHTRMNAHRARRHPSTVPPPQFEELHGPADTRSPNKCAQLERAPPRFAARAMRLLCT